MTSQVRNILPFLGKIQFTTSALDSIDDYDQIMRLITNPSNDSIYLEPVADRWGQVHEEALVPPELHHMVLSIVFRKELIADILKHHPKASQCVFKPLKRTSSKVIHNRSVAFFKKFWSGPSPSRNDNLTYNEGQMTQIILNLNLDLKSYSSMSRFLFAFVIGMYKSYDGARPRSDIEESMLSYERIFRILFETHPDLLKLFLKSSKLNTFIMGRYNGHLVKEVLKKLLISLGFRYNLETTISLFANEDNWFVTSEVKNSDPNLSRKPLIKAVSSQILVRPYDVAPFMELIFKHFKVNA